MTSNLLILRQGQVCREKLCGALKVANQGRFKLKKIVLGSVRE